jgi:hypothetical protein
MLAKILLLVELEELVIILLPQALVASGQTVLLQNWPVATAKAAHEEST